MGCGSSKEDIIAKLEELNKKELDLNLKLKDMQVEFNDTVPQNRKIKVNQSMTPNRKRNNYTEAMAKSTSVGGRKKKNAKSTKSKGKEKKGKSEKDKKKKKKK